MMRRKPQFTTNRIVFENLVLDREIDIRIAG